MGGTYLARGIPTLVVGGTYLGGGGYLPWLGVNGVPTLAWGYLPWLGRVPTLARGYLPWLEVPTLAGGYLPWQGGTYLGMGGYVPWPGGNRLKTLPSPILRMRSVITCYRRFIRVPVSGSVLILVMSICDIIVLRRWYCARKLFLFFMCWL